MENVENLCFTRVPLWKYPSNVVCQVAFKAEFTGLSSGTRLYMILLQASDQVFCSNDHLDNFFFCRRTAPILDGSETLPTFSAISIKTLVRLGEAREYQQQGVVFHHPGRALFTGRS